MAENNKAQSATKSDILWFILWIPLILAWIGRLPTLIFLGVILLINGIFAFDWLKRKYANKKMIRLIDLGIFLWNSYLFIQNAIYALKVIAQNPLMLSSPFSF